MFSGVFAEHLVFSLGLGFRKFKTVSVLEVAADDPSAVTAGGAAMIGRSLDSILRLSATPAEAVDELFLQYTALDLMAQRHVWFRSLLETLAKRRMATAPLGLKLRLLIGAGLSVADMASDIAQIISMLRAGQAAGAYALIGLIGANMTAQLLLVVYQNQHRGWRVVLQESLIYKARR
jgi:hypothetical protein